MSSSVEWESYCFTVGIYLVLTVDANVNFVMFYKVKRPHHFLIYVKQMSVNTLINKIINLWYRVLF